MENNLGESQIRVRQARRRQIVASFLLLLLEQRRFIQFTVLKCKKIIRELREVSANYVDNDNRLNAETEKGLVIGFPSILK